MPRPRPVMTAMLRLTAALKSVKQESLRAATCLALCKVCSGADRMLKRFQPVQPALEGEADTLLGLYIADMKGQNVALLTAHEEQELARQARAGDAQAFDHLVRANLRLVVNLARKCAQGVGRGVPMVELIGE